MAIKNPPAFTSKWIHILCKIRLTYKHYWFHIITVQVNLLLRYAIGNFGTTLKKFVPSKHFGFASSSTKNSTISKGDSVTLSMASFGGSDTASIIGSAILPTIRVATPECALLIYLIFFAFAISIYCFCSIFFNSFVTSSHI